MTPVQPQIGMTALPKGRLGPAQWRITVTLAPKDISPEFNLPDYVKGITAFELRAWRGDGSAEQTVATALLGPEQKKRLDPELWRKAMEGAQVLPPPTARQAGDGARGAAAGPTPKFAALHTAQAVEQLDELRRLVWPANLPALGSDPRRPLRAAWLRQTAPQSTEARAAAADRVTSATVQAIDGLRGQVNALFELPATRLEASAAALMRRAAAADGQAPKAPAPGWLDQLASYLPDPAQAAARVCGQASNVAPAPVAAEVLRHLGLRSTQAVTQRLDRRWAKATKGNEAPSDFGDLALDVMLLSAPYRAQALADDPDGEAHDDTRLENRLAAVRQEYGLHPAFGLAVDLVFELPSAQALAALWAAGDLQISVVPQGAALGAVSRWTAVSADGWPRPAAKKSQYASNGWMNLSPERICMSNLRVVESVQAWQHALRGYAAYVAAGESGPEAAPKTERSGPLVVHVKQAATRSRDKTAKLAASAAGSREKPLTLDDLVEGLRPVIRTGRKGHGDVRRALLTRHVEYLPCAAGQPAPQGDPDRVEGVIQHLRAQISGNLALTTGFCDQLFEWGDWNPAVPFPGAPTQENPGECQAPPRVRQKITAITGSNPPYRFGSEVWVACRWVLPDGTSRVGADELDGADVPWVTTNDNPPFVLQRHEPLQAPLGLMQDDPPGTPLLDEESTEQVMLASLLDGPTVRESSVRYVLPGAMRDLVSVIRHGVFDQGLSPLSSAYTDVEREPNASSTDGALFPSVSRGNRKDSVYRRTANGRVSRNRLFHPDPMVTCLHLMLMRQDADGHPWPLAVPAIQLKLFDHHHRWPDAATVKVIFETTDRRQNRPSRHYLEHVVDGHEHLVRVRVPAGEYFALLVQPLCDDPAARAAHSLSHLPLDHPSLSQQLTIQARHQLERPVPPRLPNVRVEKQELGSPICLLNLDAELDPGSTATLDLHAAWTDPVDNPNLGDPVDGSGSDRPTSAMRVDGVSQWLAQASKAQKGAASVAAPVRPPLKLKLALPHELPDGRHRRVGYDLRATGRGVSAPKDGSPPAWDWVPEGLSRQSASNRQWLSVPASVAPLAPRVRELQLAFKFDRSMQLINSSSDRRCAISVVLERGWWSSGPGELLGVVVRPMRPEGRGAPLQSIWAADPIRPSARPFGPQLSAADFIATEQSRIDTAWDHGLVLYEPRFDRDAQAWRVDVALDLALDQQQPFVKLVLARYQPNAIEGATTSLPIVADFFQLPSRRTATVTYVPGDGTFEITVCGPVDLPATRQANGSQAKSRLFARVEKTEGAGHGVDVWVSTPHEGWLQPDPAAPSQRWFGKIPTLPCSRHQKVRIVLFERALFGDDSEGPLNYFDVIPMHMFDPLSPS